MSIKTIEQIFNAVKLNPKSSLVDWDNGKFKRIKKEEIDQRGKLGENFIVDLILECGIDVNDLPTDKTHNEQGILLGRDYVIASNIAIEQKTATMGKNRTFQFEGLSPDKTYDILLLLGIAPNDIYLYAEKRSEINWANIFQRSNGKGEKNETYKLTKTLNWMQDNCSLISTIEDARIFFNNLVAMVSV